MGVKSRLGSACSMSSPHGLARKGWFVHVSIVRTASNDLFLAVRPPTVDLQGCPVSCTDESSFSSYFRHLVCYDRVMFAKDWPCWYLFSFPKVCIIDVQSARPSNDGRSVVLV